MGYGLLFALLTAATVFFAVSIFFGARGMKSAGAILTSIGAIPLVLGYRKWRFQRPSAHQTIAPCF